MPRTLPSSSWYSARRDAHLLGDLAFLRRAAELLLELGRPPTRSSAGACACRARGSRCRAARRASRRGCAASRRSRTARPGRRRSGQRVGQADHADLDQVVDLDVGRQLGDHLVRQATDQPAVLLQRRVQVQLAFGGVHGGSGDHGTARGGGAALRLSGEARPSAASFSKRDATMPAQVVARRLARVAGRVDRGPSRAARRRRSCRRSSPAWRRCARRAASCGAAPSSSSLTTRPARCGEQLHRRVGVGDARRAGPRRGRSGTARRRRKARRSARPCANSAAELARAARGRGRRRAPGAASASALEEARASSRSASTKRIAQAARGEVRRPAATAARRTGRGRPAPSRRPRRRARRHRRRATLAPRSANAVQSRSSSTPPKATCGFETTGTKRARAPANIRRRPSAWSSAA